MRLRAPGVAVRSRGSAACSHADRRRLAHMPPARGALVTNRAREHQTWSMRALRILIAIVAGAVAGAAAGQPTLAKATFAGGCFWCMEPPFRAIDGVV